MELKEYRFGVTSMGCEVSAITISNGKDAEFTVINRGATLISFKLNDRDGNAGELIKGFSTVKEYEEDVSYFGATIGRVGNRIGGSKFSIDGKTYTLASNNGENCLHGGVVGFDKVMWDFTTFNNDSKAGVIFKYVSEDGEENFPGNLTTEVTFSLTSEREFTIEYRATTDKKTPVNLTNHAYWNLSAFNENIHNHNLLIEAETYLPLDHNQIPTGEFRDVEGTCFDFKSLKKIKENILGSGGFDHNFNLSMKKSYSPDNRVYIEHPESGRSMEIKTTEPGVQFYTGFEDHNFFCLETQMYPDAINNDRFDSVLLLPGEVYRQKTIHKFNIK